eukprot:1645887-Alexandrium_andersonii.AAC.1
MPRPLVPSVMGGAGVCQGWGVGRRWGHVARHAVALANENRGGMEEPECPAFITQEMRDEDASARKQLGQPDGEGVHG